MSKQGKVIGWCMFDVASSAYLMLTAIFAVVFAKVIVVNRDYGYSNFIWSLLIVAANLIAAIMGPPLGAWADSEHKHKLFLIISSGVCIITTAALYFVIPGQVALASILVIVSYLAYSLSENFISSFLSHVAGPRETGWVSGLGWGVGYVGGLAAIATFYMVTRFDFSAENLDAVQLLGPLAAAFFLVAAIPTFLLVPQFRDRPAARSSYAQLLRVFASIAKFPDLAKFLISFFLFQGALNIFAGFAAVYADQAVGLSGGWQAAWFISLQLSAGAGAVVFGKLQDRWGGLRIINLTLIIWLASTASLIAGGLSPQGWSDSKLWFIIATNAAGACMGATQASSRTVIVLFTPAGKEGELFGFWGLAGKLSAVFAIFLFGLAQLYFDLTIALILCAVMFAAGLILNQYIDEERGKRTAATHQI